MLAAYGVQRRGGEGCLKSYDRDNYMPTLAGWLTSEQVPQEVITQTIATMRSILERNGGEPTQIIQPGAGLITFADPAYAKQQNDEPALLDWVANRRTLVYRRPLSGYHPLYYVEDWPAQGNLLFASEIKALLAVGVPRKLRPAALLALAEYGFIPAPWTIFQHISLVPAGSLLRWQRTKTILNHAIDYHLTPDTPPPTAEQIFAQLQQATINLLPPHEQIAALTYGDAASTLATLLASQQTPATLTLTSIDYKKSGGAETWLPVEEIAQASQSSLLTIQGVNQPDFWLATLAGIECPCTTTRPLTFHQLLHATALEAGARVAFTGLGADALLAKSLLFSPHLRQGGEKERFLWGHTTHQQEDDRPSMLECYRQCVRPLPDDLLSSLWTPEFATLLAHDAHWETTLHARKLERCATQFSTSEQGLYYLDLHLRLPDQIVTPVQQLAQQERIALRSPYLSPDSLDLLTRLPHNLSDNLPKHALPEYLLRTFLHYSAPLSSIPEPQAKAHSLRDREASDLLNATLSPTALQSLGIFQPASVDALLQQAPDSATTSALLLVFTTQLFCQLFQVKGF